MELQLSQLCRPARWHLRHGAHPVVDRGQRGWRGLESCSMPRPTSCSKSRPRPLPQPNRAAAAPGIVAVVLIDANRPHHGAHAARGSRSRLLHGLVRQDLTSGNPLFNILGHFCGVNWHQVQTDGSGFTIPGAAEGCAFARCR
jgi:hypothetical protein